MARFIAGIQGRRGPATRLGDTKSGIVAYAQGWHLGAEITGYSNANGEDEFLIYVNSGSSGHEGRFLLAKIVKTSEGISINLPDGLPVELVQKFIRSGMKRR